MWFLICQKKYILPQFIYKTLKYFVENVNFMKKNIREF